MHMSPAQLIPDTMFQTCLHKEVTITGIGLHSGRFVEVRLCPAPANSGIMFVRTDITDRNNEIQATAEHAFETPLCTRIENSSGIGVNTIEHFMAAFAGLGLDNVRVEIDGTEMPILDGSAQQITDLITNAGLVDLGVARQMLVITKPVRVENDKGGFAELKPSDEHRLSIDAQIDFDDALIGVQNLSYVSGQNDFSRDLAAARTFCLYRDVESMRQAGLARGGSLDNAIVVNDGSLMNKTGLRMNDEFIRHKVLDSIGDLYLLGMPLAGHMETSRPGHALTIRLLKKLLSQPDAYYIQGADGSQRHHAQLHVPEMAAAATA